MQHTQSFTTPAPSKTIAAARRWPSLFCALFAVLLAVGQAAGQVASLPVTENFDLGLLGNGWTATPSAQGIAAAVAEHPHTGSHAFKMGKSSDAGGFQTQRLDLRVDLQGKTDVMLDFWIYDYNDETHIEDGLFFSDNGGASFKKVLDFKPGDWCDYQYGRFPPIDVDELAAKNSLVLTSQFIIRWQQHDDSDQSGAPDGLYLDDINLYAAPVTWYKVDTSQDFSEDFETGKFRSMWAWRFADKTNTLAANPTRPSNLVEVASGIGHGTSQFAARFGKRCDDATGAFATNALDLHLDLTGQNQIALDFWIYDYNDETHADDGLYWSNDGGTTFKKILDFKPGDWCDYLYGRFPPIDLDELARSKFGNNWNGPRCILRFQQHDDGDQSGAPDGWYIDDVNVYVPEQQFVAALPFCEDFETGKFEPMWAWRFADQTNTLAVNPTRPSNLVEVENGIGHDDSQFAARFGKRCDDNANAFATNALDLYLNLAGKTQVEMTFWIYDYNDETHADDGIYFSNDGGTSFKKVYDLRPASWCDYKWGQFPPFDVDQLAAKHGLALTDKFVIRFQQHDNSDQSGDPDGWYIDDVCVYVPPTQYVPVPFFDDFEIGKLDTAWAWRMADSTAAAGQQDISRPSNLVKITNDIGNNPSYVVEFGKRCDDAPNAFATNALDLHLDLTGASGVKLTFDIYNYDDETHNLDGIYFSDDGGDDFVKVFDFNPGSLTNYTWFPNWPNNGNGINVDALAAAKGMSFTNQFIIRFQQHDDSDHSGDPDGIYIDNVNVMATIPTPVNSPAATVVSIFPNPATARANITWPTGQPDGDVAWQLFDAQGRTLRSGMAMATSGNGFSIDLAGLAPGLLTLQIASGAKVWQGRFVKK